MSVNESVLSELKSKFGDKILNSSIEYDILIVEIDHESNHEIIEFLKTKSEQKLDFMTTLCGLHFPLNAGKEIGVMYQMKNLISNYSLRLKTFFSIENPTIKSVSDLFPSANWQERQEFDFFGIQFEGHPDLRRILNMEEMDYHPMRKEYRLEDGTREDKEDKYFGR